MIPQVKFQSRARSVLLAASLFGLAGCVSVAPLEPIKNPPTVFRSDNTVDVEFLSPAIVGVRCAERGSAFYGVPVFHAMACGNGKLITMPDPCATFTGGAYAALACEARNEAKSLRDTVSPFLINASFTVGRSAARDLAEAPASDGRAIKVEFVHPASVGQRCFVLGAPVVDGEEEGLRMCAGLDRVVLPNPCMQLEGGWYPRTLCHEMAHANGWAMDHPGGSFLSDKKAGVDPADVPPPRAIMASLSSGAPLRKASESPIYLAYAAARSSDVQTSTLTQPAVLRAAGPATRTDMQDVFAAIALAQGAVPELLAEVRTLAANFVATDTVEAPVFAGLKLRPPSASDVFAGARLIEASLVAREAPTEAAVLQFANLPETTMQTSSSSGRLSLRGSAALHMASAVPQKAKENLVMATAPAMPEIDTGVMLAGFTLDSSDFPAPMKLAAQQRALVLRRPAVLPVEASTVDPAETVDAGDAASAAPAPPAVPSLKPALPALRRDETESLPAAGV